MRYAINKNKYLLDHELAQFEALLMRHLDSDTRNCLVLLTLLYSGARASEGLAIQASDLSDGTVLIRGLKGSDDREVPLPLWLNKRLIAWCKVGPLFQIGYRRLVDVWGLYRPVNKPLHCLRHTFAIRQLRKHGRIDVIKRLLGHRNVSNTMVYANYAYTADEFKRLVL